MKKLTVRFTRATGDSPRVGTLAEDRGRVFFEYDEDFVATGRCERVRDATHPHHGATSPLDSGGDRYIASQSVGAPMAQTSAAGRGSPARRAFSQASSRGNEGRPPSVWPLPAHSRYRIR